MTRLKPINLFSHFHTHVVSSLNIDRTEAKFDDENAPEIHTLFYLLQTIQMYIYLLQIFSEMYNIFCSVIFLNKSLGTLKYNGEGHPRKLEKKSDFIK